MVVTHRLPLEEGPAGYKLFNDKQVCAQAGKGVEWLATACAAPQPGGASRSLLAGCSGAGAVQRTRARQQGRRSTTTTSELHQHLPRRGRQA
jgi:hypothetical protein